MFRIALPIALLLFLVAHGCQSSSSGGAPAGTTSPIFEYASLQDAASFPVGVSTQTVYVEEEQYAMTVLHGFGSISAEGEMKQNAILPAEGVFDWSAVDTLVAFAEENDLRVHGHTLIWHESVPQWLESFTGTDQEFEDIIEEYIDATVRRYAGKVVSWDVVNEAYDVGNFRDTIFRQRMGDDYVKKCFQFARAADEDTLLFYNDFGTTWQPEKLEAVLAMVDDFLANDVPIDGIGIQGHFEEDFPSIDSIRNVLEEFADRGLLIHISELDIRMNVAGDRTECTEEVDMTQSTRLAEIVAAYLDVVPAEQRYGITVWGLRDGDSWLLNHHGNVDWPLLFQDDLAPKSSYFGFVDSFEE